MSKTKILKFDIRNASTGIATGDFAYVPDRNILAVRDHLVGSTPCVQLILMMETTLISDLRFAGTASHVISLCDADFIELNATDSFPIFVNVNYINMVSPYIYTSGSTGASTGNMVSIYQGKINATDSINDIVDALVGFVVPV